MENTFIPVRKGLQKDVLYKGLKAKYIMYCLYSGLAVITGGILFSVFLPMLVAMFLMAIAIAVLFIIFLFYSRTYGANGFVRKMADAQRPNTIKLCHPFEKLLLWKSK